MSIFTGYVGARSCTGGPQPGVENFKDAALRAVPESRSDGIYNCRPVRGSTTTTSLHGEGRAFDWGCKAGALWAADAADYLVAHSKELGIQCVIYNRRIWSGAHPTSGWRAYHGVDAHTTHLHIEFSWAAARDLTEARAAHYLAALEDDMDLNDKVSRVWTPPANAGEPVTFVDTSVNEVLRRASRGFYLADENRDLLRQLVKSNLQVVAGQAAILAAVKGIDPDGIKAVIDDAVKSAASDIELVFTTKDGDPA